MTGQRSYCYGKSTRDWRRRRRRWNLAPGQIGRVCSVLPDDYYLSASISAGNAGGGSGRGAGEKGAHIRKRMFGGCALRRPLGVEFDHAPPVWSIFAKASRQNYLQILSFSFNRPFTIYNKSITIYNQCDGLFQWKNQAPSFKLFRSLSFWCLTFRFKGSGGTN